MNSPGSKRLNSRRSSQQIALSDLVLRGRLPVGAVLFHPGRRHKERTVDAIVERDGLRVGGKLFSSPSAAAEAIAGGSANGWTYWRVKSSGKTLASIRGESAQ